MLPRPESSAKKGLAALQEPVFDLALTALLAQGLALPLLAGLGLVDFAGLSLVYAVSSGLIIAGAGLLARRKLGFLVPLLILGLFLGLLLGRSSSAPARLLNLFRSLLSGTPPRQVFLLYGDSMLPFLLMFLALYARLIMQGEPAFAIPLLVTPLGLFWLLGARQLSLYLPALLGLPLLYAHGVVQEDQNKVAGDQWRIPKALIVALALVFLAQALSPSQPKTHPQLAQMAQDLRRRIEDSFFFTSQRSMFTLASQGYQPMGENGLGGRPNISPDPLLSVQSQRRVYLRGTALDSYNGRLWYDSLSSQRHGWQSARFAGLKRSLFDEDLPQLERTEPQAVTVRVLGPLPSTLFVPQRLRNLEPGPDMVAYFNASSELFITRDLVAGDSYALQHEAYVAGEAGTNSLAQRLKQEGIHQLPELNPAYLSLPQHLLRTEDLVAALAREVAGGYQHPYDKGMALMRHLQSQYRYSLDVPDAPENQDFVSHFLFDVKAGYCTYFASAMTVMARFQGLPARYVEGFLAQPQGGQEVILSGKEAHAWTEIYIAGLGWVVFDATAPDGEHQEQEDQQPPPPGDRDEPPESTPEPSPEPSPESSPAPSPMPSDEPEEQEEPSPSPEQGQQDEPDEHPQPEPRSQDGKPFPWWILLLLIALCLFAWQIYRMQPRQHEKRLKEKKQVFRLYWQALLSALALQKLGMQAQETALSYAERVAPGKPGMQSLAGLHSALVYGKFAPEDAGLDLAKHEYHLAFNALPLAKRAWLSLGYGTKPILKIIKALPSHLGAGFKSLFRPRKTRP